VHGSFYGRADSQGHKQLIAEAEVHPPEVSQHISIYKIKIGYFYQSSLREIIPLDDFYHYVNVV
jgi:hypothetical protein